MKIGVLALQGAFIEHIHIFQSLGAEAVPIRMPDQLADLDGLVIPGGESTTIGKLAIDYGLMEPMRDFGRRQAVWGTCAGLIFMAKDIGIDQQPILGLMDVTVDRNAFGRQVDSFETDLSIAGLGDDPFHAIFIRAPVVTAVDESADVQILARLDDGRIVAVRQHRWLGTAFHPELTPDLRLHELFLTIVSSNGV
jgi:5'-phosphate synthase pdxT subunit